ncbi:MAG: SUMF1/EgtB/PvdO family nonheme iron enzyme [Gemmataceae bacterium]
MDAVGTLLTVLAVTPEDDTGWLALADALTERGDDARAALVRAQLAVRRDPGDDAARNRVLTLWRAGVAPCVPALDGPHGVGFVLVPPGTFDMGARPGDGWLDDDELPPHRVELAAGFFLGVTPVTRGQWRAVMGPPRGRDHPDGHPVESVSWRDAGRFCERLGRLMGRRCRLPTEAEWEYACRAGTTTRYVGGDAAAVLEEAGWCSYSGVWDAAGGTIPVGSLRPNPFGLHDMHGNLWEWCRDVYDAGYYAESPARDPSGPRRGREHVVRGGSWRGGPWFCRSSERRALSPTTREENVGFRVAVECGGGSR